MSEEKTGSENLPRFREGIWAVYKPPGMTSHDVVDLVRRESGLRRVGHGGTLDPLAEGVLVVAAGRRYTKKLGEFTGGEKEYEAEIRLGLTSLTDDAEGIVSCPTDEYATFAPSRPTLENIRKILPRFIGEIEQVPPVFSAIKVRGRSACRRVRAGEKLSLPARKVRINKIEIISFAYPFLRLRVSCGGGVYIRSLARDIGQMLRTGGCLTKLVRTRAGKYTLRDCLKIRK